MARLRAILRRTSAKNPGPPSSAMVTAGPLTLWPTRRTAEWHGLSLELTGTEFSLLEALARNAGSLISKHDLSVRALGRPLAPFDRRIDVHISSIRQKLGLRQDGHSWIQGIRGQGYQLVSD